MKLRHPELLRRQYLIRSPIWKTYISSPNKNIFPEQLYRINFKLYAAYTVAEILRAGEAGEGKGEKGGDLGKVEIMRKKFQGLCGGKENGGKGSWGDQEGLGKVREFLNIVGFRSVQPAKYMQGLADIYKGILSKYGQYHKQQHQSELAAISSKTKTPIPQPLPIPIPSPTFSPQSPYQTYLTHLQKISQTNSLDDIDILILSSTTPTLHHLHLIQQLKSQWVQKFQNNVLTFQMFRDFVGRAVWRGNWEDLGLLESMLGKFLGVFEMREKESQKENQQKYQTEIVDMELKFLHILHQLLFQHKDLDLDTITLLNKPIPLPLPNSPNPKTYLSCLLTQHSLSLQYLSLKSLFSPTNQHLLTSLQQFIASVNLLDFSEIIKKLPKNSEFGKQLRRMRVGLELWRVEVVGYLFGNLGKLLGVGGGSGGMEKCVAELRRIMLELQETPDRLYKQLTTKKTKNAQTNLRQLLKTLRALESTITLLNPTLPSAPVSPTRPPFATLTNPTLQKLSQKSIEQLLNYDIILLNKQDIQTANWVISQMIFRKGRNGLSVGGKIGEYYKKLGKYVGKREVGMGEGKFTKDRVGSLAEVREIWGKLVGEVKQEDSEARAEIDSLRKNIFILQKSLNKNSQVKGTQPSISESQTPLQTKLSKFFKTT